MTRRRHWKKKQAELRTVEPGNTAVIGDNAPVGPGNVPDIAGKSRLYKGDRLWGR
jgi:hypothetical protein